MDVMPAGLDVLPRDMINMEYVGEGKGGGRHITPEGLTVDCFSASLLHHHGSSGSRSPASRLTDHSFFRYPSCRDDARHSCTAMPLIHPATVSCLPNRMPVLPCLVRRERPLLLLLAFSLSSMFWLIEGRPGTRMGRCLATFCEPAPWPLLPPSLPAMLLVRPPS
ncbi:hypothetical protein LX32DRAFT_25282 [Colletotrichum zoysiae]|uniref:Uncharacterized protein n=1 Tax=Colletotrichum zoysiae TaxID=1216348 RepID=A0AAD9M4A1_9PEZI|nr:hypothetical protein LX32DRAFT_25282 [Colletotrichum zoysiae]